MPDLSVPIWVQWMGEGYSHECSLEDCQSSPPVGFKEPPQSLLGQPHSTGSNWVSPAPTRTQHCTSLCSDRTERLLCCRHVVKISCKPCVPWEFCFLVSVIDLFISSAVIFMCDLCHSDMCRNYGGKMDERLWSPSGPGRYTVLQKTLPKCY